MKKEKTAVADVQTIPDGDDYQERTVLERQTDLLQQQNELLARLVTAVDQLTIGYRVLNHVENRVEDVEKATTSSSSPRFRGSRSPTSTCRSRAGPSDCPGLV